MAQRILVADDDPLLLALVEHKLRGRGYEVETAEDGETALDRIRAAPPDLVVLDAMMPGKDGFGVLRSMAEDPATADIPVVMLTARRQESDVLTGLRLGAREYMVKPFMPEELVQRIGRLLAVRRPAP